jgi:tRNA threonylcarbamoyladenosine biosynthesis protein TsaE
MVKVIISNSLEDTFSIAKEFSKSLKKNSTVAFFGDLGAGKTTFIKALVNSMSDKNVLVNSPTFVYLNIYDLKIPIYHFDLYRIKNEKQFFDMGFDEYFFQDGICLIEWAENIETILPQEILSIRIKHLKENSREIIFS